MQRYLTAMREKGEIEYNGVRSVRTQLMRKTAYETRAIPLVGAVACGTPIYAEENIEEYLRLPTALVGQEDFFLLLESIIFF